MWYVDIPFNDIQSSVKICGARSHAFVNTLSDVKSSYIYVNVWAVETLLHLELEEPKHAREVSLSSLLGV